MCASLGMILFHMLHLIRGHPNICTSCVEYISIQGSSSIPSHSSYVEVWARKAQDTSACCNLFICFPPTNQPWCRCSDSHISCRPYHTIIQLRTISLLLVYEPQVKTKQHARRRKAAEVKTKQHRAHNKFTSRLTRRCFSSVDLGYGPDNVEQDVDRVLASDRLEKRCLRPANKTYNASFRHMLESIVCIE